jgi:hypothetical protein
MLISLIDWLTVITLQGLLVTIYHPACLRAVYMFFWQDLSDAISRRMQRNSLRIHNKAHRTAEREKAGGIWNQMIYCLIEWRRISAEGGE